MFLLNYNLQKLSLSLSLYSSYDETSIFQLISNENIE